MCNVFCCGFCSVTSAFCAIMLLVVGSLIKADYPYVGEWTGHHALPHCKKDEPDCTPEQMVQQYDDDMSTSSKNFFIGAGVYAAFFVLSTILAVTFSMRRKS